MQRHARKSRDWKFSACSSKEVSRYLFSTGFEYEKSVKNL